MKLIRIILALSLIIGSFALDMSSHRRRTATNAYVRMYTSLGLKTGYKSMAGTVPLRRLFIKYSIKNINQDKKNYPINDQSYAISFLDLFPGTREDEGHGSITLKLNKFDGLPNEFKDEFVRDESDEEVFTLHGLKTVQIAEDSTGIYFAITYKSKTGKDFSFDLVIRNGINTNSENGLVGMAELELLKSKVMSGITHQQSQINLQIKLLEENTTAIIKSYKKLTEASRNREIEIAEDRELDERERIEPLNLQVKQNEELITTLFLQITKTEKLIIELSVLELALAKQLEEIEKEKKEKKILLNLKLKEIHYHFEAAYFFRVFPVRILQTTKQIELALKTENKLETEKKLQKAFYPILFQFNTETN